MRFFKNILFLLLFFCLILPSFSQEVAVASDRTPEQEAIKQTEKLQQELGLTAEQSKQVYEINLRYARERQISNTRSEAMLRIKNKNAELEKVLSPDQNNRIQNKRYERATVEIPSGNKIQPPISTSFRSSSSKYRPNAPAQTISTDFTRKEGSRSFNSASQNNTQSPQSVKRSVPTSTRNTQIENSRNSSSRPQSSSPNSSRRTEPQSNSNRR